MRSRTGAGGSGSGGYSDGSGASFGPASATRRCVRVAAAHVTADLPAQLTQETLVPSRRAWEKHDAGGGGGRKEQLSVKQTAAGVAHGDWLSSTVDVAAAIAGRVYCITQGARLSACRRPALSPASLTSPETLLDWATKIDCRVWIGLMRQLVCVAHNCGAHTTVFAS